MQRRSASSLFPVSALVIALALATSPGFAESASDIDLGNARTTADEFRRLHIAETDTVPDGAVVDPNKLSPVTPAEVAECMKSWDPQTQMSKEEYEASCKSSLKYFPEK